jgi:hypothetical protein
MSKVVRLTSQEHRAWSANTPQLVDSKGIPRTHITPAVEKACAKVQSIARSKERSVKTERARVIEAGHDGKDYEKVLTIECKVSRKGNGKGEIQIFTFVEGMMRVTTREIIMARMFKKHGECQLMRPNGKFLKKIRDPNQKLTNVGAPANTTMHAPEPHNCACKDWGAPHPGKHFPMCQYNQYAPQAQRGTAPGEDSEGHPIRKRNLPPGVNEATAVVSPVVEKKIPSPDECECKKWERQDPNKHHNICQYKTDWENRNRPDYYLASLDTGETVRKATPEEVAAAEVELQRTGQAQVEIEGGLYLVCEEKDLPNGINNDQSAVMEEIGEEGEEITSRGTEVEPGDAAAAAARVTDDVADFEPDTTEPPTGQSYGDEMPDEDSLPIDMPGDDVLSAESAASQAEAHIPAARENTGMGDGDIDEGGLPLPGLS